MWTWLERVNYEHQINRWYVVAVQNSLFSELALIRFWGSRGTDFQQIKIEPFENANKARDAADRLIRSKVRKGYRVVSGYVPPELDAQPADGKD
jgi:predicted DNA-binding WGR domain protein